MSDVLRCSFHITIISHVITYTRINLNVQVTLLLIYDFLSMDISRVKKGLKVHQSTKVVLVCA